MNILTDILSLFKRKQIIEQLTPDDLIVVGRHEQPDMLGIASPIPYKSVKLIKAKDLTVTSVPCSYANLDNGNEPIGGNVYINTTSNPCTINLRRIVGTGNNLAVTQNGNQIEISTIAEPNTANNVGVANKVYKNKIGEVLQFKTLDASNDSISIEDTGDTLNFKLKRVILNSPDGGTWEVTVDNSGQLVTSLIA
jgi:hypothetical protein